MGIVGTLLRNRRAGEAHLAWNLPGLAGPQTLELRSEAFADGAAMPAAQAGEAGGRAGAVAPAGVGGYADRGPPPCCSSSRTLTCRRAGRSCTGWRSSRGQGARTGAGAGAAHRDLRAPTQARPTL
jgi:hypothetical protein